MTLNPAKDPSCVLAFDWGEGAGNVVYDLSGNGNHGTIYGATRTRGILRYAGSFDGKDDYVEVPHSSSLNITSEITIIMWVKPSITIGAGAFYAFTDKRDGSIAWGFYWHRDSYAYLFINAWVAVRTSVRTLQAGKWYMLAATAKSNSTDNHIYINGVEDSLGTSAQTFVTNTAPVKISADYAKSIFWPGLIGLVRIYNRALSEKEIREHYYYGIPMLKQKIPSKFVPSPLRV